MCPPQSPSLPLSLRLRPHTGPHAAAVRVALTSAQVVDAADASSDGNIRATTDSCPLAPAATQDQCASANASEDASEDASEAGAVAETAASETAGRCVGAVPIVLSMGASGRVAVRVALILDRDHGSHDHGSHPIGGDAAAAAIARAPTVFLEVSPVASGRRAVLAVLSLPISVLPRAPSSPAAFAASFAAAVAGSRALGCHVGAHCCRLTTLAMSGGAGTDCNMEVVVAESPGHLGIGGKVWDSALVLLLYLKRRRAALVEGKRVAELGKSAAASPPRLTITGAFRGRRRDGPGGHLLRQVSGCGRQCGNRPG